MDVLMLIDRLDDLVHNARRVRLREQVRVGREEVYDIVDRMRATIPEDVEQAQRIVKERQEILAAAKREAQRIVEEAGERQAQLVSQHELTRRAELEVEGIIDGARAREREIRVGAGDYADEVLTTLEVNLARFITAIERGRERLGGADDPPTSGNPRDARFEAPHPRW